jgi:hypothetical protein
MAEADRGIGGGRRVPYRVARRRRTHESTGWAYAGSQRHIQAYVNTPALIHFLDAGLKSALPTLAQAELEWRSPLAGNGYEEPRGASFWPAIARPELGRQASKWWPDRGPSWDAIAITRVREAPTIVLVEAKANIPEFTSGAMAAKARASIEMIEHALDSARGELGANQPLSSWTGVHYQLANRIAWTRWLRAKGADAVFAYVVFYNDRSHIPATREELTSEANGGFKALGLSQSSDWYATVALPATG